VEPIIFLDTETTGTIPGVHEAWEVAVVVRDPDAPEWSGVWQLPVDESAADPEALAMNGWHERRAAPELWTDLRSFAGDFCELTAGAWLVGANPGFDAAFLDRILRGQGIEPRWLYRLVCVENLVAGAVGRMPAGLHLSAEAVGIDPALFDRHSALGDARLAQAVFDKVMGGHLEAAGTIAEAVAGGR
jgi:DNA polymerase III epsilon subunit-like protein